MADNDGKPSPSLQPVPPSCRRSIIWSKRRKFPPRCVAVDRRVVWMCGVAIVIGFAGSLVAQLFVNLIAFITNLAFFGRISLEPVSPGDNHLGLLVLFVPIVGGFICGLMARYGSKAIRGHGIPEAMETGADQSQPHSGQDHFLETRFGGRGDRHRRTVRRRRADYRHRRRAGLAVRSILSHHAGRTTNAVGRRRRGRHVGDLRQSGGRGVIGDRIVAVRISPALDYSRRTGQRHGGRHANDLPRHSNPVFPMPDVAAPQIIRRWCFTFCWAR